MFSKISRYRFLADMVSRDARGRTKVTKDLRLPPDVTGDFRHTLADTDRLDHLAFKYYKQPTKWWRICDANPEFMSPQALLGAEPIETARYPLNFTGPVAPWTELVRRLSAQIGIEDVQVVEDIELVAEQQVVGGQTVTVNVEHYRRAVVVTYNRMNLGTEQIAGAIEALGFAVDEPQRIGRVGKPIVVPPDAIGARA
jgi:hypothetical protein